MVNNLRWISPIFPFARKIKAQEPGRRTKLLCEGGEENVFLTRSVLLCNLYLLAQEGTPLTPCIDNDNCQQGSQCGEKKHFHAHRIAWTRQPVLYSEFADKKQL